MPKVLEAVVLIVAVKAAYRTLKKKEARICRKREDQRKGGPAVLALETITKGFRRLCTITMKDLVIGRLGFR